MSYVERAFRALMHLNIAATLGLATWLLWASWSVVLEETTRKDSAMRRAGTADSACQCPVLRTLPRA